MAAPAFDSCVRHWQPAFCPRQMKILRWDVNVADRSDCALWGYWLPDAGRSPLHL